MRVTCLKVKGGHPWAGVILTGNSAGLIIIGGGAGLEHAFRALRRFVKLSADIPDDRIVTLTGYASKPGEVKSNPALIEEARKLGGRMADILTSAHSPEPA